MTPCKSTLIELYEYSDATEVLAIVFRGTREIRLYKPIPVEMFWDFESAESKGKFFNENIAKKFDVQKGGVYSEPDVIPPPAMDPELFPADTPIFRYGDEEVSVKPGRIVEAAKVEPVQPEIMSPDQAVAVISPKNPKADELTKRLHAMAASTSTILVKDKASQHQMETHLVEMTTVRKVLFDIIDPYRAIAYAAYEQIQKLNKSRMDPVDVALKDGKMALNTFIAAEQQKAVAEQRRLQAAADAQAELDRQKRTEELRLQAAQEAQEAGDAAQAELILSDETIQAAPMPTYAPRVEMPSSSLPGRASWKARVIDAEAAILDVAEGIRSMKAGKGLAGHAPMTILKFDEPGLKSLATANKTMFSFPGLEAYDDRVLSTTKMKG